MNNGYVEVRCKRLDCRGNIRGECTVLTDNNFGDRECPFFKTRKEFDEQEKHFEEKKREEE